ncbi:hypothetical protein BASA81_010560 [Batrachochytrium salamandrivorans]|nr:hypothetical protein BASA81_010560 [Batrachochytrium salamandrivorans]
MSSKLDKELAVFGHGGTSLVVCMLIVSALPVMLAIQPFSSPSLVRDLVFLVLPVLLAHTSFGYLALGYAVLGLCYLPRIQASKEDDTRSKISLLRATTVLSTVVAILAVDFPSVFPRAYCKTEWSGTGLMDLGVGAYVFTAALSSTTGNHQAMGKQTIVLLALGFARLAVTQAIEYQTHAGEYGMHWNFFFTMAAIRLCGGGDGGKWGLLAGMSLLALHQSLLSFSILGEWVNHSDHNAGGLVWQNKEGILSLPGYVALDWITRGLKRLGMLQWNAKWLLTGEVAMLLALRLVLPSISRRSCNASFVVWILSIGVWILCLASTLPPSSPSRLVRGLSSNQLTVFVLANLGTGIVNHVVDTLHTPPIYALGILSLYLCGVIGWATSNNKNN